MNCAGIREALDAQPVARPPVIAAHLATCPECARYAAELAAFDAKLRRALEIPVPERAAPAVDQAPVELDARRAVARRPPLRRGWLALAASAVLAVILVAAITTIYPRQALASAVVGHMSLEPDAWVVTDVKVPDAALTYVLHRSGVSLEPGVPQISYAHSCWFRGWYVPHLVVQTTAGPMTVMVLRHEHVARDTPIDEGGYRGVIVPAGRGALAILSRGSADAGAIDAVAARVAASVRFAN
ncbi:MAG TPA: DUF3379 family protein [Steroidobacteraceae bacterium]|nr:DUF3379 family protein [Steroidobacteraceae bacterium]